MSTNITEDAQEPRPISSESGDTASGRLPGIDLAKFADWAAVMLPELPPLRGAKLLSGGHSNLNILLDFEDQRLVLRRPPLGHIMESAHNMEREHRALAALADTAVPVPRPLAVVAAVDEATGVDSPFFVMDFVQAEALSSPSDNAGKSPDSLREASEELARSLANLHSLDPTEIGLGEFGRADGYLARQLKRWAQQLDASRSRPTPELDRLIAEMPEPPHHPHASVVHGDFKMNNALVDFSGPTARIAAVLDWEMATIGDPYADLAMFGTYWDMPATDPAIALGFESPVDLAAGYPTFSTLLDVYEQASGRALPDMRWYRAFAAMKIGVITESLHYRFHIGAARGDGFERMAAMTEPIARIGLRALTEDN